MALINNEPSFKIENTKVDSKNRIEKLYAESMTRRACLVDYYAKALFYNPEMIGQITSHIAAEIGYQKAVKDLSNCVLQLVG